MKKLIFLLTSILFLVAALTAFFVLPASGESYVGICGAQGDNMIWMLETTTGELVIYGTGEMDDFSLEGKNIAPWQKYKRFIRCISISDGVTSIGKAAFAGCYAVTTVLIPGSVIRIGSQAFNACSSLATITLPEGIPSIKEGTFYDCRALQSIVIPNSVAQIGSYAFENCVALEQVTLPMMLRSIGNEAFYGCSRLKGIALPAVLTRIAEGAFGGCIGLECITVDGENTVYRVDGNCLIHIPSKSVILGCKNSSIPSDGSVERIAEYAFVNRVDLVHITIPEAVTLIGGYAFYGCSGLESVSLSEGVTSIDDYAFAWCSKLSSVALSSSVTYIAPGAFQNCHSLEIIYNCSALDITDRGDDHGEIAKNAVVYRHFPGPKATCSTAQICVVCGEALARPAHAEMILMAVPPTFFDEGLSRGTKCAACGEILVRQEAIASYASQYAPVMIASSVAVLLLLIVCVILICKRLVKKKEAVLWWKYSE